MTTLVLDGVDFGKRKEIRQTVLNSFFVSKRSPAVALDSGAAGRRGAPQHQDELRVLCYTASIKNEILTG